MNFGTWKINILKNLEQDYCLQDYCLHNYTKYEPCQESYLRGETSTWQQHWFNKIDIEVQNSVVNCIHYIIYFATKVVKNVK